MDREWIVYRHGYNAFNNPAAAGGPEDVRVARVRTGTAEDACALVRAVATQTPSAGVTVYANQYLYARDAAEVDAEEEEVRRRVDLL
jgi:hypothetical protein